MSGNAETDAPANDAAAPASDIVTSTEQNTTPTEGTDTPAKKPNGWPQALGLLASREIVIDSPRLTVNLPDKGGVASITVTSGQSLTPLLEMVKRLAFKKVQLKDGTFVFRTPSGFTQTIYGVDATITGDKSASLTTAKGVFKFRGEELAFELSSLKPTSDDAPSVVPISFLLSGKKLNARLAGSINLDDNFEVKGKLQLTIPDIKFASGWLGYPLEKINQTSEVQADGAFSWKGSVLSFLDGKFQMGKSSSEGAISIDLAGNRPRIDGTMAVEEVDLRDILADILPKTSTAVAEKSGDSAGSSSTATSNENTEIDLGYLKEFDADFRLSAESLKFADIEARECAFTLTLKSGDLHFGLVEGKVGNGMVHGELGIKTSSDEGLKFLRADLENIELELLGKLLNIQSPIKGAGHLKIDLNARGTNVDQLLPSASGEVNLRIVEPASFGLSDGRIPALTGDQDTLGWWRGKASGFQINEMQWVAEMQNGIARSNSLTVKTPEFDLEGTGEVKFSSREISLVLVRKPPSAGSEGEPNGFDDNASDKVLLHGPWNSLEFMSTKRSSSTPDVGPPAVEPINRKAGKSDNGEAAESPSERG